VLTAKGCCAQETLAKSIRREGAAHSLCCWSREMEELGLGPIKA